jgi:hypothetical protein
MAGKDLHFVRLISTCNQKSSKTFPKKLQKVFKKVSKKLANNRIKLKIEDAAFKKDVDRLLNIFKPRERKIILRKASRPLQRRMKNAVEFFDYTGEARDSIRSMTFSKSDSYFVGPKKDVFITQRPRSKTSKLYHPFYMAFIEYGFTHVRSDKYIPGTNFIANAVDASKAEVFSIIRKEVNDRIRPYG